jgi:hypothetical protein
LRVPTRIALTVGVLSGPAVVAAMILYIRSR